MATPLTPLSTKQFSVVIDGQQAKFTRCTAPKTMRDEEEYNDGSTGRTDVHLSFQKNEKVTLGKPYDHAQDQALLTWYQEAFKVGTVFTVTIQAVDTDLAGSPIAGGRTMVLTGCRLASFKLPEVNRTGTGVAELELEVIFREITFQ